MRKRLILLATAAALLGSDAATAQGAPGWLKLLHWISGDSDRTDVPVETMDSHMQMSVIQRARPGDGARAAEIVDTARAVLRRYPTAEAAQRDGYKPFNQTGQVGEEVHYTSIGASYAEGGHVNYARPGSILFRRTAGGLVPVGVMYAAPGKANAAELDARAPLGVATWHRHIDFCWALGKARDAENAGPRFGYAGSIHDEATCRREAGYWLPLAFGWMTHVYPGRAKPWGDEEMRPGAGGPAHPGHDMGAMHGPH